MEEEYLRKQLSPSLGYSSGNYMGFSPAGPKPANMLNNFAGTLGPEIQNIMLDMQGKNPVTNAFELLLNRRGIDARDEEGKGFTIDPMQGSANVSLGKNFNLDLRTGPNPGAQLNFNFNEPRKQQNTIENTYIPGNERISFPNEKKLNAGIQQEMIDMRPRSADFIDSSMPPEVRNKLYRLGTVGSSGPKSAGRQALIDMLN